MTKIILLLLILSQNLWARNYLDSLRPFWQGVYPKGGETLYCQKQFKPYDRRINVEHIYPMAWVTKQLKCGTREQCRHTSKRFNQIESDMHNMYAARKDVNKTRGHFAFGMIPGEDHYYKHCDFEIDFKKRRVEPSPYARGKIARAMLYMEKRYGLKLYKKQKELMRRWHRQYPPDAEEKRHNQAVKKIQGRGNPFID